MKRGGIRHDKCLGVNNVVKVRPLGVKYTLTTLVYDPAFIKWGFLFLFL